MKDQKEDVQKDCRQYLKMKLHHKTHGNSVELYIAKKKKIKNTERAQTLLRRKTYYNFQIPSGPRNENHQDQEKASYHYPKTSGFSNSL